MNILAISGSLRTASLNLAVLEAASTLAPAGVTVDIYGGLGGLPHFNPDLDGGTVPAPVGELRRRVGASSGLLIACPEYAHGVPGVMKNGLDWLVSSLEFPAKPVALINTAPHAFHAQAALRETLVTMSARLIPEAFVTLRLPSRDMDAARILADAAVREPLRAALARFIEAVRGGEPLAEAHDGSPAFG